MSVPKKLDKKKLRLMVLLVLAEYGKKKVSGEEAVKSLSEEINKVILKECLSNL
ncbi:MAG: hypothetical protein HA495_03700 [Thaumarchaeota archaeon]|jgi:hypothetical protein|nr:hypothetical protein [Nitrososphaerota archaeon]